MPLKLNGKIISLFFVNEICCRSKLARSKWVYHKYIKYIEIEHSIYLWFRYFLFAFVWFCLVSYAKHKCSPNQNRFLSIYSFSFVQRSHNRCVGFVQHHFFGYTKINPKNVVVHDFFRLFFRFCSFNARSIAQYVLWCALFIDCLQWSKQTN